MPERYFENSPGSFYVENDDCLTCGACVEAAPILLTYSEREYPHCYFYRQPETPTEIDLAIKAVQISDVKALRYAGSDEYILRRLVELGLEGQCDALQGVAGNAGSDSPRANGD